jgi:hypothetical protein
MTLLVVTFTFCFAYTIVDSGSIQDGLRVSRFQLESMTVVVTGTEAGWDANGGAVTDSLGWLAAESAGGSTEGWERDWD